MSPRNQSVSLGLLFTAAAVLCLKRVPALQHVTDREMTSDTEISVWLWKQHGRVLFHAGVDAMCDYCTSNVASV